MITPDFVQHAIVTVIAVVAAAILLRRLVGAARPAAGAAPGCAKCPSNTASCHVARPASGSSAPTEHPLAFVRSSRR